MVNLSEHTLLTEQEAANLLQPFMPRKPAETWLAHDRRSNPSIPFFFSQGQIYYREVEVVAFIRQMFNPTARFVRINDQLCVERRHAGERRKATYRRKRADTVLQAGIERRHEQPDRRLRGESDRRSGPARQQSA